ncbi:MAG: glycoside-pentoside-hexuronide (GPH):cation symporter [Lachnospiraceae bacterium]|nr:glycoside-pentoside-hexuronide (GPH):cation symporter [Lachnospiraceae bacterium]
MSTKETKKIPIPQKVAYGCGMSGGNIMSVLMSNFITAYYTDTALIAPMAIATMMVVARVFDGVSDFTMGSIVDRTNTKIGKARPWVFAAAPLMLAGIILILNVPQSWESGMKLVYAYVTYIFLNAIVYTIYGISHTALLARMSHDSQDRTLTSTIAIIMQNLAQIAAASGITVLYLNVGWRFTSVIVGAVAGVLILIEALLCQELTETQDVSADMNKEKKQGASLLDQFKAVLKCKYFWCCLMFGVCTLVYNANAASCTIYYCTWVLGDSMYTATLLGLGVAPSIIMLVVTPWLTQKFSKRGFMSVCSIGLILSFALINVAPTSKGVLLACAFLRSFAGGPMFAGIYAFIADSANYVEWKTGIHAEGLMASSQSMGQKIGMGIGGASVMWVLAAAGYDSTLAAQSEAVISALKFSYIWVDAIVCAVLLLCILLLDVEKYLPQMRNAYGKGE